MGEAMQPGALKMLDMSVPEFFFTCLGPAESAGPGLIKYPCCLSDGGVLIPQFLAVTPIMKVAYNCKLAIHYAAEFHNEHILSTAMRMQC
jgi:hypothetical protein